MDERLKANARAAVAVKCICLSVLLLAAATGIAHAHAFPRPYDLPLPLGHWLAGAKRQTAAVYLKTMVSEGLLEEVKVGRENLYINPALLALLSERDQADT